MEMETFWPGGGGARPLHPQLSFWNIILLLGGQSRVVKCKIRWSISVVDPGFSREVPAPGGAGGGNIPFDQCFQETP